MTLKLILASALLATLPASAEIATGSLNGAPNLDFHYLPALSKPAGALQQGQVLQLQSRLVWDGASAAPIATPQHAVVAFTQSGAANSPQNNAGELLWTHGAGAILGERGLRLELWYRTDTAGNGYEDDVPNAIVWGQDAGRCAADVQGTIPPGTMCLSAEQNGSGYLTPEPNFALRTGVAYWLRVALTPTAPGWATLYADLIEEQRPTVPVQSAMIGFPTTVFFPLQQPFTASVARTAGGLNQPTVQYTSFDYGF